MRLYLIILLGIISLALVSCGDSKPTEQQMDSNLFTGNPGTDALIKKLQEEQPTSPQPYDSCAALIIRDSLFEKAIPYLQKAISLDSNYMDAYSRLADCYLYTNQSRKAIDMLEKAVAKQPNNIRMLLSLAELQYILVQYEGSGATLQKVLDIDPTNADAFYLLGMNYKENADAAKAAGAFQTAVEQDPDMLRAYVQLGRLSEEEDQPVALKYFENVLRIDSTNRDGRFGIAWHYHKKKNLTEAGKWYKKIILDDQQDTEALYNYAYLSLEADKFDEAIRLFTACLGADPTNAKAYFFRAVAYEAKGNLSNAMSDYETAQRFAPNDENIKKALAKF